MTTVSSTFALARALGGGAMLSGINTRYVVSDFSPSTGEVYGWPVEVGSWAGIPGQMVRGDYQRLPDDLSEPMPDRAAYMSPKPEGAADHWRVIGAARHAVYYGEMVTDHDKHTVLANVGIGRLIDSTDPHLNDIELSLWDTMALRNQERHRAVLRTRGQGLSLGDGVCIFKAAARALIAEHNAKREG